MNKAKSLKDAGTTIYSIGVVSGANPGDTSSNLNKYMHGISSNYPDATATSSEHLWGKSWNANLGDRAETSSYYKAATDAGQLNNIFESIYQEITKTAEYADVTIHDRLSSWVVSSDSASENGEPAGFTYTKTRNGQITAWDDAPEATVAADGTVSWPVTSNDDTLEDGVTYTVSFNVKPTQAAFDEAVKNHKDDANASGDNNFYTNDNSSATVDYKTEVTSSQGGPTALTAILSRARGIVAVVSAAGADDLKNGETVIVNAAESTITTEPSDEQVAAADAAKAKAAKAKELRGQPGAPKDG